MHDGVEADATCAIRTEHFGAACGIMLELGDGISFSLYAFEDITGYTAVLGPHTPMMSCPVNILCLGSAWQDIVTFYVQFELTRLRVNLHVSGAVGSQATESEGESMTLPTAFCQSLPSTERTTLL